MKNQWKKLTVIAAVFAGCYFMPIGQQRFDNAIMESLYLVQDYAREHVLTCLLPAFFIAGAISVFLSQSAVMKYLGAGANKIVAYTVASVSGAILAVCSCTILPLFAGIYKMGAGLGPATAFLYSGPAINVLAIILTARILGADIGLARAIGAIIFSVVIGLLMQFIFRNEKQQTVNQPVMPDETNERELWQNALYFASMVGVLVFANWGEPKSDTGLWMAIYSAKWFITSFFSIALAVILFAWFNMKWYKLILAAIPAIVLAMIFPKMPVIAFAAGTVGLSVITATDKGQAGKWFSSTLSYATQIMPLLFFGVIIAGLLLGRPEQGQQGLIPSEWVAWAVGGNSVRANFFASIAGAFMYFATLTEVPILKGLIDSGMGKGPALALLLAGPALSLPNMLVIRSVMGTKKTVVFVVLVIVMAAISGIIFGAVVS